MATTGSEEASIPAGTTLLPVSEGVTLKLSSDKVIGNGSFGVVFEARIAETNEVVAIKRVLQDKRFKNRELQIMKVLSHTNVVALRHHFYQTTEKTREDGTKEEEQYLNLVLEFVPDTVYKITRHYTKLRQLPPMLCVKLYVYQMCRSLAYLHSVGICHRDIKPQNLLVDSQSHVLKLCDFGSAKSLQPGEPSVSYICSRYYRAPELIFGSTEYTTAIDVWSAGCVAAELLLGHPLFPGETGVDQLVEIIKVLGTPTKAEVEAMNPNYTEFKFPQIRPYPWTKIFRPRAPPEAIDLMSRMLSYVPQTRITALEACRHVFFDELRQPGCRLPNDAPLPQLFNWTAHELLHASPELREALVPPHARQPGWTSATAMTVVPPPPPPYVPAAGGASAAAAAGGGAGASVDVGGGGVVVGGSGSTAAKTPRSGAAPPPVVALSPDALARGSGSGRGGEVGGGGVAPVSPGGGGRGSARAPASGAKGALTP